MKSILLKIGDDKVFVLFFLNIFLFPIYPNNLKPTLIVLLLIATIAYTIKNNFKLNFKFKKYNLLFWVNVSLFFVFGLSILYSKNASAGFTIIFRMLPLIIFPLIFKLIYDKDIFSETLILKGYKLFYIATVLLFFSFFVYFYFNGNVTVNFLRNYNERINTLLGRYSIHPIYASMYVSIALILSTSLYNKNMLNKGLIIFINILLVLNLILLARKSAVILMFVFFVVYQMKFRKIRVIWKLVSVLSIVTLATIIIIFIPDISYRFKDLVQVISDTNTKGSTSIRVAIFKCSYYTILENPIFGYGLGGVKEELYKCYSNFSYIFNGKYYNSHNQYMSVWLSSGIFGFISLLTMLTYNFMKIIKSKDFIFAAVLILFSCIMAIESIFFRQDGVLLFSLFFNLFAFKNLRERTKKVI